jgi:hypothetical protein
VIGLILFIAIGAGLLLLALRFLVMRRSPVAPVGAAGALVAAKRTLAALETGLLPADSVERVFGRQDVEYVESLGSTEIRELFLTERKRLALLWIREVRKQVGALKEFHTRQARLFANLSRRTEFSIAIDFAYLQIQCAILEQMIQWRGPYAAPHFVRRTSSRAAGLCRVLDKSLAFLTPALATGPGSEPETLETVD